TVNLQVKRRADRVYLVDIRITAFEEHTIPWGREFVLVDDPMEQCNLIEHGGLCRKGRPVCQVATVRF
ncbi:MAG: hypothetical protein JSW66_07155, partial [Phycisphaerales bacterium]